MLSVRKWERERMDNYMLCVCACMHAYVRACMCVCIQMGMCMCVCVKTMVYFHVGNLVSFAL